ncbi:MAG: sigma factor-like helix-turn-helix DNA-binding protein [Myxococcota bacterium]
MGQRTDLPWRVEDLQRDLRHRALLPQDQRDALTWTVIEGQSLEEVAERPQVARETEKKRLSRARRARRRRMGSSSEGEVDEEGA